MSITSKPLTDRQHRLIVDLVNSGLNFATVAREVGCSSTTVRTHAHKAGATGQPTRSRT